MTDETDAQAWARQVGLGTYAAPGPAKSLTIADIKDAIDRLKFDGRSAPAPPSGSPASNIAAQPIVGWSDVSRFDGLPVYVQQNWPRVQRGTRAVRFPAHPLILWIARKLGAPQPFARGAWKWTYQEIRVPNLVDVDPLIIDGALHCSPAQWEVLRQVVHSSR